MKNKFFATAYLITCCWIGGYFLLGSFTVTSVSCITPQTKQDISTVKEEIKTAKTEPASPDKDALLATLQARLAELEAKAVQERADSTKAILSDTTVALEGLSPFANMAVPGGGLIVAGLAAFLRRFI